MILRSRRRPLYGAQVCALIAALLLLLSVSLLYSRLNSSPNHPHRPLSHSDEYDAVSLNPLLDDTNDTDDHSTEDPIDQLDDAVLDTDLNNNNNSEDDEEDASDQAQNPKVSSMYFYDQVSGVVRRGYNKRSIEEWEDYVNFESKLGLELGFNNEKGKAAFGSDDIPVDEKVRKKLVEVGKVEDALLLKGSALREGWGEWFDKKSDFLRRDRMFKSNLEGLNPLNNPMLQDPDGSGVTGLTRGDRIVIKGLMNEFKKVPFLVKKPLAVPEPKRSEFVSRSDGKREVDEGSTKVKRAERRTLDDNSDVVGRIYVRGEVDGNEAKDGARVVENNGKIGEGNVKNEFSGQVFANGERWGYYPGLDERLSFNNFMDAFFRKGKCSTRVFMVWNSPPWMYGVRHQRGLESVLLHHPHACIVVFSESIELNFFNSFVNDGYKVSVVMPNLDELLKDTPVHIFASVWYEWKKTKFYPTHYSELIRLVALYKYGGIYLDSDIIVLKPLSLLDNNVALEEEEVTGKNLNGAVMAFRKHSPFIMECLMEYYSSYDETLLRWNGADLLSRVASNFSSSDKPYDKSTHLKLLSSSVFFPIGHRDISRYFSGPTSEIQRAEQDYLFQKILKESITFHFWNSITSALVPDSESLVARILNHLCIHCFDVL